MSKSSGIASPHAPSHGDIVDLVGDLDETVITAIVATKASYAEIEEAVKRITGDAEQIEKSKHSMSPRVEAVYDILMADPAYAPEPDR